MWIRRTLLPTMGLTVSDLKKFISLLFDIVNVVKDSARKKRIMKFLPDLLPTELLRRCQTLSCSGR
jgi:hypothetical protein